MREGSAGALQPSSTYRLQFRPGFGFDEAAALAPYLKALGVSHLYASPYLQAAPGSPHGYDVVEPTRVSEELGGEEGRGRLVGSLARHGLGQVLDIVPNHMAARAENPLWWDLLENGPWSEAAPAFDVVWDAPEERVRGKVLVPILGDHYGRLLRKGELALERRDGSFVVRYHEHALPLTPETVGRVLGELAESPGAPVPDAGAERGTRPREAGPADRKRSGAAEPASGEPLPGLRRSRARRPSEPAAQALNEPSSRALPELATLARALRTLPRIADASGRRRRARDLAATRERLAALLSKGALGPAVDARLSELSGDADALHAILEAQHHRLAHWHAAARELNYRRFFNIDTLVGVRVEDADVFERTHARILEWLGDGSLDGVRVDHVDGLRGPRAYLERLRERAPQAWIVVEKILGEGEALRSSWPVDGTTGYDAACDVLDLFVDPAAEAPLTELFADVTGRSADWKAVAHGCKHQVLRDVLASDLEVLAHLFLRACEERRLRDFTRWELRETLRETLTCLSVYRTYVDEDGGADEEDLHVLAQALAAARARRPDLDAGCFDLLGAILRGEREGERARELRMRFQQASGPVMAKAVEDTAFYAWPRFVALNEVGGAPGRFGATPDAFHARCRERAERQPRGMTALSTHDSKRSEDVRARLALLSEIPGAWAEAARSWSALNARHRQGPDLPERAAEYLLYQTLVGAFPLSLERALAYMEKASREARVRTSWTDPAPRYDEAVRTFVEGALNDEAFREALRAFVAPLVAPGRVNALAQKLVQLTMPGVPDLYQGSELWDLRLVDPDNRRPVDFASRARLLGEIDAWRREPPPEHGPHAFLEEIRVRADEGLPKLWVVSQALAARRRQPEAFGPGGDYALLAARGARSEHAVAFVRGGAAITIVPRLVMTLALAGGWSEASVPLPGGAWTNVLTGERWEGDAPLARLLEAFPVALLERAV